MNDGFRAHGEYGHTPPEFVVNDVREIEADPEQEYATGHDFEVSIVGDKGRSIVLGEDKMQAFRDWLNERLEND